MDQAPLGYHHYQLALKRVSWEICVEGNEYIDLYTLIYRIVTNFGSKKL